MSSTHVPRISVLMPVYNSERFLQEAVNSILNQTYQDYEFIIVDDGSTDRTSNILANIKDHRVIIIRQANRGVGEALNKGLEIARGEYIARMDADDISLRNRFECQVTYLDRHPEVAALGTAVLEIDEKGRPIRPLLLAASRYTVQRVVKSYSPIVHPSVMMRTSIIKGEGGYRSDYGEDHVLWISLTKKYPVENIRRILLLLRNSSTRQTVNSFLMVMRIQVELYQFNHPQIDLRLATQLISASLSLYRFRNCIFNNDLVGAISALKIGLNYSPFSLHLKLALLSTRLPKPICFLGWRIAFFLRGLIRYVGTYFEFIPNYFDHKGNIL